MMTDIEAFKKRRDERIKSRYDDQWITIGGKNHEGEKTGKGTHILIGEGGEIKGGAGGKFNGKTMSESFGGKSNSSSGKTHKQAYADVSAYKDWKTASSQEIGKRLKDSEILYNSENVFLINIGENEQNIIGKTLVGLKEKFPVYGCVDSVISGKDDGSHAFLRVSYYKKSKEIIGMKFGFNPDTFSEKGKKYIENAKAHYKSFYDGDGYDVSIKSQQENNEYYESIINQGKDYWGDTKKELEQGKALLKKMKFMNEHKTPYNTFCHFDTYEEQLENIVCHEYGHYLMYTKLSNGYHKTPQIIINALKDSKKDGSVYEMSEYAAKDGAEFFAEAFAMHAMGRKIPETADKMLRYVLGNDYYEIGG